MAGIIAGTHSVNGIANDWNRRGIKSTYGNAWVRVNVKRVLTSDRIAGILLYRGEEKFPAQWESIVPEEDLETARAILNDPGRATSSDSKVKNLLSYLTPATAAPTSARSNRPEGSTPTAAPRASPRSSETPLTTW